MIKPSIATINALFASTGLTEQLDGGKLYIFAGPVPADADAALDMGSEHTEIVTITINDSGTGLSLSTPAGGAIGKPAGDVWSGTCTFDGFEDGESSLVPTFYRFCADGDNGRSAANTSTGYRVQGTCGGPNSGADLQFGATALNSGDVQPIGVWTWGLAH